MFYIFYVCVFFVYFFSNLYLYNTVLSVLLCVNKDIIIIKDVSIILAAIIPTMFEA